jgi:hypothetical protein
MLGRVICLPDQDGPDELIAVNNFIFNSVMPKLSGRKLNPVDFC